MLRLGCREDGDDCGVDNYFGFDLDISESIQARDILQVLFRPGNISVVALLGRPGVSR